MASVRRFISTGRSSFPLHAKKPNHDWAVNSVSPGVPTAGAEAYGRLLHQMQTNTLCRSLMNAESKAYAHACAVSSLLQLLAAALGGFSHDR